MQTARQEPDNPGREFFLHGVGIQWIPGHTTGSIPQNGGPPVQAPYASAAAKRGTVRPLRLTATAKAPKTLNLGLRQRVSLAEACVGGNCPYFRGNRRRFGERRLGGRTESGSAGRGKPRRLGTDAPVPEHLSGDKHKADHERKGGFYGRNAHTEPSH